MATLLDGKKLSQKILDDLKEKIAALDKKPALAVILVGEDSSSKIYVANKQKKAAMLGISSPLFKYPENIDEKTLINKISELNNNPDIDAILVQLPLPAHLNSKKIIETISPKKDVDGLTSYNAGRLIQGLKPYAYPCTPKGIIALLDEYKISIEGKHAVIVGRSNIVGKPLAQMLLNRNATVTVCHSKTQNLAQITKAADILIAAVGNKIINREMIKLNSVIVSVGISRSGDGKIIPDIDFDNIVDLVDYITPTPGGVGPMTIASLMSNTYELYLANRRNI